MGAPNLLKTLHLNLTLHLGLRAARTHERHGRRRPRGFGEEPQPG
jgi:hypothetical protein